MTKKKSAGASGAAKRRKNGPGRPEKPPRAGGGKADAARPAAPNDPKPTVRRLRSELAKAMARIEELKASADTDFLLDILNRRGFERELTRAIAFIKRYHASGALVVLDVDRLKPINDEFGHAAGDQVLKAIVQRCCARCAPPTWSAGSAATSSRCCCGISARPTRGRKRPLLEETHRCARFCVPRQPGHHGRVRRRRHPRTAMRNPRQALEEADSAMYVRKAQRRHETQS